MIFITKVAGIPCQCKVTHYAAGVPAKLSGHPDTAVEAEPEEFEFDLLNTKGICARWLERKLTNQDHERLLEEFHITMLEEKHGYGP